MLRTWKINIALNQSAQTAVIISIWNNTQLSVYYGLSHKLYSNHSLSLVACNLVRYVCITVCYSISILKNAFNHMSKSTNSWYKNCRVIWPSHPVVDIRVVVLVYFSLSSLCPNGLSKLSRFSRCRQSVNSFISVRNQIFGFACRKNRAASQSSPIVFRLRPGGCSLSIIWWWWETLAFPYHLLLFVGSVYDLLCSKVESGVKCCGCTIYSRQATNPPCKQWK